MDGELNSIGMTGELVNSERLLHPYSLPNLTQRALGALFPDIPEKSVRHRHLVLFGMMESGKTVTLNYLAMKARQKYGDQLNIIPCYSIRRAMDLINSQKVQLILIDDAIREANARQSMKQAEDVGDFYQIRHLYESIAKDNSGIVITVWACQRFKSLDIVFRQGHVLIFKTGAVDPDDSKMIRDYVGGRAYDRLQQITEQIFIKANDDIKSESVVTIPIASGVQSGTFRTVYVQPFLKFIGSEEIYEPGEDFSFNVGAAVEKYRHDVKWRKAARIYYRSTVEGQTYERIAEKERLSTSTIGEHIEKMRGELSRVAGAEYEKFKSKQLQQRGYNVEHQGGESQPDIIATHGQTKERRVISCKCLDFDRKMRLPIAELNPEIHRARELGAALILSVYNLHDQTDQEIPLDRDHLPKRVDVNVLG